MLPAHQPGQIRWVRHSGDSDRAARARIPGPGRRPAQRL